MKPPRRYPYPDLSPRRALWRDGLPLLTLGIGVVVGAACAAIVFLTLGCL